MKVLTLTAEEREQTGFTHKAIILYSDIPAGTGAEAVVMLPIGTAGNATPGNIPVGMAITDAAFILATQFASGTLTGLTAELGDSTSATHYIGATQVQSGQTPVTYAIGTTKYVYAATDQLKVTFTPTGGNTNTLTAGELDVLFTLKDFTQFALSV